MKWLGRWATLAVAAGLACAPAPACTIFVLADGERALFFNNEDYSNPDTRLWFAPGGKGFKGAVYVGFDDGWAQGGLNEDGLAYDWVAGFADEWRRKPGMKSVRGNSSQRMAETCSTVEEAIKFYEKHWEASFAKARILVADKSGASAIIGAKDGKLHVERASGNRGFGYGRETLAKSLSPKTTATEASGVSILNACAQPGQFATKYSTVYDLREGKIAVYRPDQKDAVARFNLRTELQRGAHVHAIPQLGDQSASPSPAPSLLKRFAVDEWTPVSNQDDAAVKRVRRLISDAAAKKMRKVDYADAAWAKVSADPKKVADDLKTFGKLKSVTQVEEPKTPGEKPVFKLKFTRGTIVQRFTFDAENRVVAAETVAFELEPR